MFIYFGKEVVSKDCIVEELASDRTKEWMETVIFLMKM